MTTELPPLAPNCPLILAVTSYEYIVFIGDKRFHDSIDSMWSFLMSPNEKIAFACICIAFWRLEAHRELCFGGKDRTEKFDRACCIMDEWEDILKDLSK